MTLRGIESVVPASSPSDRGRLEGLVLAAKKDQNSRLLAGDPNADFSAIYFRAGILQLLTSDRDVLDTAANVAVSVAENGLTCLAYIYVAQPPRPPAPSPHRPNAGLQAAT